MPVPPKQIKASQQTYHQGLTIFSSYLMISNTNKSDLSRQNLQVKNLMKGKHEPERKR